MTEGEEDQLLTEDRQSLSKKSFDFETWNKEFDLEFPPIVPPEEIEEPKTNDISQEFIENVLDQIYNSFDTDTEPQ